MITTPSPLVGISCWSSVLVSGACEREVDCRHEPTRNRDLESHLKCGCVSVRDKAAGNESLDRKSRCARKHFAMRIEQLLGDRTLRLQRALREARTNRSRLTDRRQLEDTSAQAESNKILRRDQVGEASTEIRERMHAWSAGRIGESRRSLQANFEHRSRRFFHRIGLTDMSECPIR